jgi:hypothetical protein
MTEIPIDGDVLISDEQFCQDYLNGTRRTARHYDHQGLPYVMLAGKKYRPLNACKEWLSSQIKRLNPQRPARATRRRT